MGYIVVGRLWMHILLARLPYGKQHRSMGVPSIRSSSSRPTEVVDVSLTIVDSLVLRNLLLVSIEEVLERVSDARHDALACRLELGEVIGLLN